MALVRVQDYLPPNFLSEIISEEEWEDDVIESPINFDADLDFWKMYRKQLEVNGANMGEWHVSEKNNEAADDVQNQTIRHLTEIEDKRNNAALVRI